MSQLVKERARKWIARLTWQKFKMAEWVKELPSIGKVIIARGMEIECIADDAFEQVPATITALDVSCQAIRSAFSRPMSSWLCLISLCSTWKRIKSEILMVMLSRALVICRVCR